MAACVINMQMASWPLSPRGGPGWRGSRGDLARWALTGVNAAPPGAPPPILQLGPRRPPGRLGCSPCSRPATQWSPHGVGSTLRPLAEPGSTADGGKQSGCRQRPAPGLARVPQLPTRKGRRRWPPDGARDQHSSWGVPRPAPPGLGPVQSSSIREAGAGVEPGRRTRSGTQPGLCREESADRTAAPARGPGQGRRQPLESERCRIQGSNPNSKSEIVGRAQMSVIPGGGGGEQGRVVLREGGGS